MSRFRAFCFTVNNYETLLDPEQWEGATFVVYQEEVGSEGTSHLQGYAELGDKRGGATLATVKRFPGLETAHIERRRGTAAQARAYCEKEDTRVGGPYTWGVPAQQGKRSDLIAVQESIAEGADTAELWTEHFPAMVRYHRAFDVYRRVTSAKRSWETTCITLIGPSGCGKTRWVHQNYDRLGTALFVKGPGKWWDGYDGEDVVLIDEMYGSRFTHGELLQLTDRYAHSVEVKGAVINFAPRVIIFTSNAHPSGWYVGAQFQWEQSPLRRRLTQGNSRIYVAGEPHTMVGEVMLSIPLAPAAIDMPVFAVPRVPGVSNQLQPADLDLRCGEICPP